MKRLMNRILFVAVAALVGISASAQERITSYDSEVQVRPDGSLEVTERIAVRAEGNQIRRGIYRDFPTRYRDRFGNRVKVDLQVLGVERNGVLEPWFTERLSNGVRINTGNDDFLAVPADYTFTIRYRTTRQLGFFENHDELYWNAIGTGWIFPIEQGSVEVRLPSPVPGSELRAEAYTGAQGTQGTAYDANVDEGVARYRLTEPLAPYEGFTIVLSFPKGIVTAPTSSDRVGWFLKDNRGVLIGIVGLTLLLLYCIHAWRQVGRDPAKGIIIARYEPREGHTPAGLRFMTRMGYDTRCFTADVLALAVSGHIRIHREDKLFKDEWRLGRTEGMESKQLLQPQRSLLHRLFPGDSRELVLKNTNASLMQSAKASHQGALDKQYHPQYFKRNGKKLGIAILIAIVSMAIAFMMSGGFGIPFLIGIAVFMLATLIVFGRLIRAPTAEGRELLDELEGLRLYMKVAERQELASMRGPEEPQLDAERYEALLPFAVALDVEEAWTKKFTAAVGAAQAAQTASNMRWYSGRGGFSNIGDFTNSVSSGLSSSISSASTPPGSSSGGGGGGSSGGGGGGGGGGGR